jgi:hypothetical protein
MGRRGQQVGERGIVSSPPACKHSEVSGPSLIPRWTSKTTSTSGRIAELSLSHAVASVVFVS